MTEPTDHACRTGSDHVLADGVGGPPSPARSPGVVNLERPLPADAAQDPRPSLAAKLRQVVRNGVEGVARRFGCSEEEAAERIGRHAGVSGIQLLSWCRNCPLSCPVDSWWVAAVEKAENEHERGGRA
jgi:hypothetical protein